LTGHFPWGHSRRFNSSAEYFKRTFGGRVQKLTLDAGFTCPNRDGSLGTGGCTFCNNDAFNPSYCDSGKTIAQQLREGIDFHQKRYRRAGNYLAYFQAYSNTYGELDVLKSLYQEALDYPGIIGLVIGTRPDCVTDEILDYLQGLGRQYYIAVEYGVESHRNSTLKKINRGHTFEQSVKAIRKTAARGILTGVHMILGFPGEDKESLLEGARLLNTLPLHSVKLHQLQIIRGTRMEEEYKLNPGTFHFYTLDEYIDLVIDYLEVLNPSFVVERFAGEVPPRFLAGPGFGLIRNDQILVRTEKRMEERNTLQGRLFFG
jgi:radical SAM protein (TIGR01212 family)